MRRILIGALVAAALAIAGMGWGLMRQSAKIAEYQSELAAVQEEMRRSREAARDDALLRFQTEGIDNATDAIGPGLGLNDALGFGVREE